MPDKVDRASLQRGAAYRDLLDLLYETTSRISSKVDVSDLIKSMVTGLKRLGFDRAGVWLLDDDGHRVHGTWGTDENGELTDESQYEMNPEDLPVPEGYFLKVTNANFSEKPGIKLDQIYLPKGAEDSFSEIWGIKPPYPGYYAHTERGDNIFLPIVASGKVIGAIGVDNFISERRIEEEDAGILAMFTADTGMILHNARLMAELHQRTTFLESIMDNANFWISLLDKEGNVTLWNRAAERISGYTREEVTGSDKVWECLFSDPDHREGIFANTSPAEWIELGIKTKSGAKKIISWYCMGIQDVDGQFAGRAAIGEDITERREMELALKRSEKEYRRAIETANSFVLGLDKEGRISLFNQFAERLTGYKRDEVVGKSWFDMFIPPGKRGYVHTVFQDVKLAGQPSTYESAIIAKDGHEILMIWSNSAVRDDAGNLVGTLSYGIDVTQQRKLENQLTQSEKMSALGQLISGIAHELNNPLTGVIGYSQLIMGADCDGELKRMVNIINREATRCYKIVDSLLHFAREYKQQREYAQINDVIESTLNLKRYQLYVDNIKLELHLSSGIPETLVDPHQMQQVFVNIVNNAHQAMVEHAGGGKLTIETELDKGNILVRITDTGPGIPEENIDRIFEPFFTTKDLGKGTGLGLSICHSIVEEHDGRINVSSELDKGSTFTIILPVTTCEIASVIESESEKTEFEIPEGEIRILIVDDEQEILKLFTDIVSIMGHNALTARNGSQAIDKINEGEYDLIICDMKMPGFNGRELYNSIKMKDPELAKRMIFVTGDTVNPDTQDFLQSTGNLYIGKPFGVDDIKQIIHKGLSSNEKKDLPQVFNQS